MYKKTGIFLTVILCLFLISIKFFREAISDLERLIFLKQKIEITSETNSDFFFYFKNYDEPFFSTEKELVNFLIESSDTDSIKTHKIFSYTCKVFYYDFPYSQDTFLHRPIDFLYTYGYGYCDDAAAFFVNLCKKAGLDACVINFDGHVAAQAFYNHKWHYFDPSTQKYLQNENGNVLSVREIMQNKELVHQLYDGYGWPIFHFSFRKALSGKLSDNCNQYYISKTEKKILPNILHRNAKIVLNTYEDKWNASFLTNKENYKSGKCIYTFYPNLTSDSTIYFQTQFRYETITFYIKKNSSLSSSNITLNNRKLIDLDLYKKEGKITYNFIENQEEKIYSVQLNDIKNSIDSISLSFIFNAEYLLNDVFMPTLIDTNGNIADGVLISNIDK